MIFTLNEWYHHHQYHIDKLFEIFLNHLYALDRNHQSNNDYVYRNFVIYLYQNSSHLKPFIYHDDIDEYNSEDELSYLDNAYNSE